MRLWEGLRGGVRLRANDPIARFIYSKNYFSVEGGRVKASAFMPKRGSAAISVFVIRGLGDLLVAKIGRKTGARRSGGLKGWARLQASGLDQIESLWIELDNKPWRHANVSGWPEDKSKQKAIALELSERSTLDLVRTD